MNGKKAAALLMLGITLFLLLYPSLASGSLLIKVTNSSKGGVQQLHIKCGKAWAHNAEESDQAGWFLVTNETKTFELVDLSGKMEVFAQVRLPIGKYNALRLSILDATALINNTETKLKLPSKELVVQVSFNIGFGKETVLSIDFNPDYDKIVKTRNLSINPKASTA